MIIELKALKVMQNSPGIAELVCILICQKENFDSPDPYDLEHASLKHTVAPWFKKEWISGPRERPEASESQWSK